MFSTIQIKGSQYLFDPLRPAGHFRPYKSPKEYTPATLLHWPPTDQTNKDLKHILATFEFDDVWNKDFLEVLICQKVSYRKIKKTTVEASSIPIAESFKEAAERAALPEKYQNIEHSQEVLENFKWTSVITLDKSQVLIPQGPYLIHSLSGHMYSIFKLYEDTHNAFVKGVLTTHQLSVYKWLSCTDKIRVPSRLYSQTQTGKRPLRGMRFAVKDSINVQGLEISCGNRAWSECYGLAKETAPFIKQLINAGAVLVGKTRLVPFCDGLNPVEITDEIVPVNPRGDRYQKPSSSSSGSAVACAAYPWLDFTIGTDTGGSIRHPAGVNGVYGMRPSTGIIQSNGFVCSTLMDTVGICARSASILKLAMNCVSHDSFHLLPKSWPLDNIRFKLLYCTEPPNEPTRPTPKFFPFHIDDRANSSAAGRCFEEIISKLENYFGQKRQRICLYETWNETNPGQTSDPLSQAVGWIYNTIVHCNLYRTVQPFYRLYRARHEGRAPFTEAVTKARIEQGSRVTNEDYDKAVYSAHQYGEWVNEILLPNPCKPSRMLSRCHDDTTQEIIEVPLLVYPQSWGTPQYRDENNDRNLASGICEKEFSVYSLSHFSGCPEVVVPIGEVGFESRISQMKEFLPVALSILAPRGMDRILVDLLSQLEGKKVLRSVVCGRRTFAE